MKSSPAAPELTRILVTLSQQAAGREDSEHKIGYLDALIDVALSCGLYGFAGGYRRAEGGDVAGWCDDA